jgi:hypothetical protein
MQSLKFHQVFGTLNLVVQDLIGIVSETRKLMSAFLYLFFSYRDHLKLIRVDKPLILFELLI